MYTKIDMWNAYCTIARLKRELIKINEMNNECKEIISRSNQLLKESANHANN